MGIMRLYALLAAAVLLVGTSAYGCNRAVTAWDDMRNGLREEGRLDERSRAQAAFEKFRADTVKNNDRIKAAYDAAEKQLEEDQKSLRAQLKQAKAALEQTAAALPKDTCTLSEQFLKQLPPYKGDPKRRRKVPTTQASGATSAKK